MEYLPCVQISTPVFFNREVGTITYRSGPEWELRFNRKRRNPDETPSFCPDYEIEHYLARQVPNIFKTHTLIHSLIGREIL